MAIYRTGTAAMTSAGVVTGSGTTWTSALSLIRVGSTIMFLTSPAKLATISSIVSDTELRVTGSGGATVPAGTNYAILLSDSLTVDGLAQDIAETLKYYQGKETQVEQALTNYVLKTDMTNYALKTDLNSYPTKANNLSDLTDKATALVNLGGVNAAAAGITVTGSINQNNANNIMYNGFFAGAGDIGTNFGDAYAPGVVMRRGSEVWQGQIDSAGRWMTRRYTSSSNTWSGWVSSMIPGDFGVGTQSYKPTNPVNSFISEDNGASLWAASNGCGFQAAYVSSRLAQFLITQSGAAYIRWNQTGDPQAPKSTTPWTLLQNAGASDARFKDIKGDLDVETSLDNVNRLEFKLFNYTFDSDSKAERRGVIAQQAMTIDSEYVHTADDAGIMSLDSNPLLMDALASIKALTIRDNAKTAQIESLTLQVEELRSAVEKLTNN